MTKCTWEEEWECGDMLLDRVVRDMAPVLRDAIAAEFWAVRYRLRVFFFRSSNAKESWTSARRMTRSTATWSRLCCLNSRRRLLTVVLMDSRSDSKPGSSLVASLGIEGLTCQLNTLPKWTAYKAELWLETSFLRSHFMRKLCIWNLCKFWF